MTTETGAVKCFNERQRLGFMTLECGDKDLFTQFSEIKGSASKTLAESQHAEFEVMLGQKGPQASKPRALA
jgi:CspA family cold shock protein